MHALPRKTGSQNGRDVSVEVGFRASREPVQEWALDGQGSEPVRKSVPGSCGTNGEAQWVRGDEQQGAPKKSWMQTAVRGGVVGNESKKEQVRQTEDGKPSIVMDKGERDAGNRGGEKPDGRDNHEPLVSLWLAAVIESRGDENRENQNVKQRNGKETEAIGSGTEFAARGMDGSDGTDDEHERGEHAAGDAQAPMKAGAIGRDERDLREEEKNPAREQEAVKMKQRPERGSDEKMPKVVGSGETRKDDAGCQKGECGVE